jgi:hypothetical protein
MISAPEKREHYCIFHFFMTAFRRINPFAAMGRIVKEEGWKAAETAMLTQCRAFSDEGKEEKESASSGQDLSTLYQGAQFPSANSRDHR